MNNEDKILQALALLQSDMNALKTDVAEIKGDVAVLKGSVAALEANQALIQADLHDLRLLTEEGFRATRSELTDAVEVIGRKVEHLEISFSELSDVTAQNAFDVQMIKRRA